MISRLKALKNQNKQAKSWHYIYVKFPMRLCEINDLRAARRLALSKTEHTAFEANDGLFVVVGAPKLAGLGIP